MEFVSNNIDFFISTNSRPEISASLFWEALNAFLMGKIISNISHKTKLNKRSVLRLHRKLPNQNIFTVTTSPDISKEHQSLQAEFDILLTSHAENVLLWLLALQLWQESTSHLIPQKQMPSGITTDPILINNHFKNYYTSLYASEQTANSSDFDHFLVPLISLQLILIQLISWKYPSTLMNSPKLLPPYSVANALDQMGIQQNFIRSS